MFKLYSVSLRGHASPMAGYAREGETDQLKRSMISFKQLEC